MVETSFPNFSLHVAKFPPVSGMITKQLTLPGLTKRGRPRSDLARSERIRRNQAERRKTIECRSMSVEVESSLLVLFKEKACNRNLSLRGAVEDALRNWINQPLPINKKLLSVCR